MAKVMSIVDPRTPPKLLRAPAPGRLRTAATPVLDTVAARLRDEYPEAIAGSVLRCVILVPVDLRLLGFRRALLEERGRAPRGGPAPPTISAKTPGEPRPAVVDHRGRGATTKGTPVVDDLLSARDRPRSRVEAARSHRAGSRGWMR
jgi:hypothetical protein